MKQGIRTTEFWTVAAYAALVLLAPEIGIALPAAEQLWAATAAIMSYAIGRPGVKIAADMLAARERWEKIATRERKATK